jgi:hypothetical protein
MTDGGQPRYAVVPCGRNACGRPFVIGLEGSPVASCPNCGRRRPRSSDGALAVEETETAAERELQARLGPDRRELVADGGVDVADQSDLYLEPVSQRTLTALFGLAIFIHVPLDLAVTALAWEFETNPVVLELGLVPWSIVKLGLLVGTVFVYWDSRRESPRSYPLLAAGWLGILIGLGLGLIFPNVAIVLAEWFA